MPPGRPFTLSRWDRIETVVWDGGTELHRSPRRAAPVDGGIAVTGPPEDFAEEVCRLVFNAWGLRLRRDLVDLLPAVAIQLSRIGDERFPVEPPDAGAGGERGPAGTTIPGDDPLVGSESGPDEGGNSDEEDQHSSDEDEEEDAAGEQGSGGGGGPAPARPGGSNGDGVGTGGRRSPPSGRPPDSRRSDGRPRSDPGGSGSPRQPGSDGPTTRGGRGHTAADREGIIGTLLQRRAQLDEQLREATATGVIPAADPPAPGEDPSTRSFQSDERFRKAVMAYESEHGRIPQQKADDEKGHDIDSYVREKGSLGRKLARRIEVKGKGVPWTGDQIVELSDRQFTDASKREVECGVTLAPDFDYWLYVVEDHGTGKLTVLPIRNPARRAAHYEFRAGTWRHLVEFDPEPNP